jgi:hypothetical protein
VRDKLEITVVTIRMSDMIEVTLQHVSSSHKWKTDARTSNSEWFVLASMY